MLEIYIIIILSIFLIIEEFYPFSFPKEENENEIEENMNKNKAILIIPLSSLEGNSIIEEYLDLDDIELIQFMF